MKDPVCGMSAKKEIAYEYRDQKFCFCSDLCRDEFKRFPEQYLNQRNVSVPLGEKQERRIAYFSMEVGIESHIPTYSGGLGVLAGDTIRSCADLKVPMVVVTLLYEKGYFYQKLDTHGNQKEMPVQWYPEDFITPLTNRVSVRIENRTVFIRALQYEVIGITGHSVPVIFLDTNLEENSEYDRGLNDCLYGGDLKYRFAQEIILGIGGLRMLHDLGYSQIKKYHMNEGHASLLTLELLRMRRTVDETIWKFDEVRNLCVFTTHTPVPAGHDQFSYDLVKSVLGDYMPFDIINMLGGDERLNLTLLALNLSKYINGVAKKHGEVSKSMFPGYSIDSITNGVHSNTWTCDSFKELYSKYIAGWRNDPFSLRYALSISKIEIWQAHMKAKKILIDYINKEANAGFHYDVFTIGFARRAAVYKRADMIFSDVNRIKTISQEVGDIQFVFAGKAHPQDLPGKELIKRIFSSIRQLKGQVKIIYLENYDIDMGKMFTSGVDLWLNTPQRPKEASGTSGMKAAHNGVPSFSVLDGWWVEGHIEGITGWSIGKQASDINDDVKTEIEGMYEKLETVIVPMFYNDKDKWIDIMKHSIAINASFFNTHRMVLQYVLNSYFC